ncbi:TFIIB-type zinc ribbon-containing protein [Pseudogemmobacter bohemicus]|uniref:TFIIB-type zinc ribbon-containing protein n=1 Tax=Pseudogemmobacter bohemicus TaxID=2250708 RepID=UPI000DD4E6D2|nr:zf-TFIIB domain-containing protein [Pseudogemmobacter bohemicus]
MDPVFAAEPARRTGGLLCPHCRVDLVMSDRQGIEIDYCPQCRGVWLDRGELDKIIERSTAEAPAPRQAGPLRDDQRAQVRNQGTRYQDDYDDDRDYRSDSHDSDRGRDRHGKDRRDHSGSFLRRLFD